MITVAQLKKAAEELRDEMTNEPGAMIYPMAMDVLASTPVLVTRLINKLNERSC